jgi:DNA mismatch repair ATPase MutS
MDVMLEDNEIVYLYQLVPGQARGSFPEFVAAAVGVDTKLIARSRKIAVARAKAEPVPASEDRYCAQYEGMMDNVAQGMTEIGSGLTACDHKEMLDRIQELLSVEFD